MRGLGEEVLRRRADRDVRDQRWLDPEAPVRLLIGPAGSAGQAWQWSRAAERHLPGVSARTVTAEGRAGPGLDFPRDIHLSRRAQLHGTRARRAAVLRATHVLSEGARSLLGDPFAGSVLEDLPAFERAGIRTGILLHGSEIRDPHRHAGRDPHSPFSPGGGADPAYVARLVELVGRTRDRVDRFPGPVLVSTVDLLDDVPGATWLPVVVDTTGLAEAAAGRPVLQRPVPVVLHVPSNRRLKGTDAVEAAMAGLQRRGLVEYRRLEGVRHRDMAAALADADVVIDQVVLGNPGVLLTEALAAGRLAVAHLTPTVRERLADADPASGEPPVLEADPVTIGAVVEQAVTDRDPHAALAARGPAWARARHDGRMSARVLDEALLGTR